MHPKVHIPKSILTHIFSVQQLVQYLCISVFSIDYDFNLKVGEKKNFKDYIINFQSIEVNNKQNYKAIVGIFDVINLKTNKKENLTPEIRIYDKPKTLTYEASIKTKINHDLYLTMSNLNRSEYYNIKFQKKPFMLCIWLSAFIIAFGGFLRLFKNEN